MMGDTTLCRHCATVIVQAVGLAAFVLLFLYVVDLAMFAYTSRDLPFSVWFWGL
jgi:hypothetical protein